MIHFSHTVVAVFNARSKPYKIGYYLQELSDHLTVDLFRVLRLWNRISLFVYLGFDETTKDPMNVLVMLSTMSCTYLTLARGNRKIA